MIYFTSDLHLGHRAIIRMANRPFCDVEDMNKQLIDGINSFVKPNDTLYMLGDIAYRIKTDEANDLIKKINGKKIFLRGNHDKPYDESLFTAIYDYYELVYEGIRIDMMHYPLRSWHVMRHGAIQLHGHIHAPKEYNDENKRRGLYQYDVGVDANNYLPVSIRDILDFFKDVPLT